MYRNLLGNVELMQQFDPNYEFRRVVPVPSGFFASHRDAIPMALLAETMRRLNAFHEERGLPALTRPAGQRRGVFNADQGVVNYLLFKAGITPGLLKDVFVWGAKPIPLTDADSARPFGNLFVHWGGCPRPNFTHRNVPAGDQWIRFYYEYYRNRPKTEFLFDTARNILDDVRFRCRAVGSKLKRRLIEKSGK